MPHSRQAAARPNLISPNQGDFGRVNSTTSLVNIINLLLTGTDQIPPKLFYDTDENAALMAIKRDKLKQKKGIKSPPPFLNQEPQWVARQKGNAPQ